MRVFSVKHDPRYQYLFPLEGQSRAFAELDGSFRADEWAPPRVSIPEPQLLPGDFFNFSDGFLITGPEATKALHDLLAVAGELLPIPYDGQIYTLLNVTECYDCLDHDQTICSPGNRSGPMTIRGTLSIRACFPCVSVR